jgi:hypothetical protein
MIQDRLTFYGATDLEARRRALRFQCENLDYVLIAVVEATWDLWAHSADPTHVPGEQSITMAVERLRPVPGSTVSGTRIILLDRAAAMLKLLKEEAMAMAYAGGEDASAAERRARLEAIQKERQRTVAAMKGATCRATGWPKTAPHGYAGDNADAWLHAWKYCDAAMRHETAPPGMADLKATEIWEWSAAAMNGAAARAVNWSRDAYAGDSADAWRRGWDHCNEALRRHAEPEYKEPARPRVDDVGPKYEDNPTPLKVKAVYLELTPLSAFGRVSYHDAPLRDKTISDKSTRKMLRTVAQYVGWQCYQHSRGIDMDGEWIDVTELSATEDGDAGDI